MIKAMYLGDAIYFESLEEAKAYYGVKDAKDVEDINDALRISAEGMASPILSEMED